MTDINITHQEFSTKMILHLLERKDLESLKTQQLIKMLRYERIHYGVDYDFCEQVYDNGFNVLQQRLMDSGQYTREGVQKYSSYVEVKTWKNDTILEFTYADRNQLKEILKSRPHILNKEERRKLTKEEIKKSKGNTKKNLTYKR